MNKIELNSLLQEELADIAERVGDKTFRGQQIYNWLYRNKISNIDEMKNLPSSLRNSLSEISQITTLKEIARQFSKLDGSVKLLLELPDKEKVECVILPDGDRVTACISSQVGCKMGCKFCSTARIGFKRNLTPGEIIEQVRLAELISTEYNYSENGRLTNIVFMGMGEPLDNIGNLIKSIAILTDEDAYSYSHKRITISTAGVTNRIREMARLPRPVNLAISLNASNQQTRENIMPIAKKYTMNELMKSIRDIDHKKIQVTLEYVLLGGINDSKENARELVNLVGRLPVKINLIRYNGRGNEQLLPPQEKNVLEFQKILVNNNIKAFIRKSLGADISGACGQLAAGYNKY